MERKFEVAFTLIFRILCRTNDRLDLELLDTWSRRVLSKASHNSVRMSACVVKVEEPLCADDSAELARLVAKWVTPQQLTKVLIEGMILRKTSSRAVALLEQEHAELLRSITELHAAGRCKTALTKLREVQAYYGKGAAHGAEAPSAEYYGRKTPPPKKASWSVRTCTSSMQSL